VIVSTASRTLERMTNHVEPRDGSFREDWALLRRRLPRRQLMKWLGGAGLIAACGPAASAGDCVLIPSETAGPYPGDGTNGANALTESGIVRSNITSSFGALSGTAAGVPLTLTLTVVNTNTACAPAAGLAVYLWHCDRAGAYSLYTVTNQNYLRGLQVTDANGQVTFQTIFPGCYSGRWPHAHFEVFANQAAATSGRNALRTSQLALPQSACAEVYATSGYETSVTNLSRITLATDNIFSDGSAQQLATVSGSLSAGLTASLVIPVAV
jgi:protocatechuate 3,4-dioxygenase beta subunit